MACGSPISTAWCRLAWVWTDRQERLPGYLTILKPRHSAFYASPLELLLAEMQARELVICGLATDMCVQLTAGDAFLREFATWVPADCTAAESNAAKAASLEFMSTVLKCDTRPWAAPAARHKTRKAAHA